VDDTGEGVMFEKQKEKIDQIIQDKMVRVANHISKRLTDSEVPVVSGEYLWSHEVATQARSYPRAQVAEMEPHKADTALSSASASAFREQRRQELKANASRLINAGNKQIAFNNKAKHANFVEHVGWKKTPPYHVFNKAFVSTMERKKPL